MAKKKVSKRKVKKITSADWGKATTTIAQRYAYDEEARAFCGRIQEKLPRGMKGVVMVNADTRKWFNAANRNAGWTEARRRWGKEIAHPPIYMIVLTEEAHPAPPPPLAVC